MTVAAPAALTAMRGDSLVFTVAFYTDAEATVPWNDVEDYTPLAQFRMSSETGVVAAAPAISYDANEVTFALTDTVTEALVPFVYVWDVQFIDPTADEGLGKFTWPAAPEADVGASPEDSGRNTLTIYGDVTIEVPS